MCIFTLVISSDTKGTLSFCIRANFTAEAVEGELARLKSDQESKCHHNGKKVGRKSSREMVLAQRLVYRDPKEPDHGLVNALLLVGFNSKYKPVNTLDNGCHSACRNVSRKK